MYSAHALKPGAKKIELLNNPDIPKWWPETGGEGIIEPYYPGNREVFRYKSRKGNILEGVSGLGRDHTQWVSVKTGGLSHWYKDERQVEWYTKGRIQLDSKNALEGAYSARIAGNVDSVAVLSHALDSAASPKFLVRFQMRLSEDFSLQPNSALTLFFARIGKLASPKMVLASQGDEFVVRLSAGPSESLQKAMRANTVPLVPGKSHVLEMLMEKAGSNRTMNRLWIDGHLQCKASFEHQLFDIERFHFTLGKASHHEYAGWIWIDNPTISNTELSPLLPQPVIQYTNNALLGRFGERNEALPNIIASQWQISTNNSWLCPIFNSGRIQENPFELPFHSIALGQSIRRQNLYARFRLQNLDSGWSAWNHPFPFKLSDSSAVRYVETPRILDAYFTHANSGRRLDRITIGQWVDLHLKFTPTWHHSFIDVCLTGNPEYCLHNRQNRGGEFRPEDNYVASISFPNKGVWAMQKEGTDHYEFLVGKRGLFCDDTEGASKLDPGGGKARIRLRLPSRARPGIWKSRTFLSKDEKGDSPYFERAFMVMSDKKNGIRTGRLWIKAFAVLVAAAILSAAFFLGRTRRAGAIAGSKLKSTTTEGKTEISEPINEHVQAAKKYIKQNFAKPISLQDVAKETNLSPDWLGNLFKNATGTSVLHFINEMRVKEAERMLCETGMRVNEIAFQVGFNSIANFNRAFRKIMGKSPSSYRQRSRPD